MQIQCNWYSGKPRWDAAGLHRGIVNRSGHRGCSVRVLDSCHVYSCTCVRRLIASCRSSAVSLSVSYQRGVLLSCVERVPERVHSRLALRTGLAPCKYPLLRPPLLFDPPLHSTKPRHPASSPAFPRYQLPFSHQTRSSSANMREIVRICPSLQISRVRGAPRPAQGQHTTENFS